MNIKYISKLGEVHTIEGWALEAIKFYDDLNTDADFPVVMPSDWWERWVKVLGINGAVATV
jgi:hypothetical protein